MSNIKNKVSDITNKFGTSDVYELCDYLNIFVKRDILGENIKGATFKYNGSKFIILNNKLDEYEEKVVLAHEIGHSVMHEEFNVYGLMKYTYMNTNKFENEANEFAAHLLIPDKGLLELKKENPIVSIEMICDQFDVPWEIALIKIQDKKI